jgi:hypothetical protein
MFRHTNIDLDNRRNGIRHRKRDFAGDVQARIRRGLYLVKEVLKNGKQKRDSVPTRGMKLGHMRGIGLFVCSIFRSIRCESLVITHILSVFFTCPNKKRQLSFHIPSPPAHRIPLSSPLDLLNPHLKRRPLHPLRIHRNQALRVAGNLILLIEILARKLAHQLRLCRAVH